jgi:hypothetical protein
MVGFSCAFMLPDLAEPIAFADAAAEERDPNNFDPAVNLRGLLF